MPANNNNNNNDIIVLAQSTKEGFIDIPKNGTLVVENKFTKATKIHSKAGVWFTFPGFCFNTIIYTTPFTKKYSEEKYNVTDMPEVRMTPQITFRISDPDTFYRQICGRNVTEVKQDSKRMEGLYNIIKVAIRNIVVSCDFKLLENFSLRTITNALNNEVYNQGIISDKTFQIITQEFTNIENTYGIKITNLGFEDVTKPEIVQKAELEAKKAAEDKKAMVTMANAKKEAAEIEKAAITTRVEAYLKAGVPKEDVAKIIMMEKMNGGTVVMGTRNNPDALLAQLLQNMNNNQNTNDNQNTNESGRQR